MRISKLSMHACRRLSERSRLNPDQLKALLDNGATVPVATQKGGRFAQHLVYSSRDRNWFIVVQDADDGGVLTVMPLSYLDGRLPVTASQKRSARRRVLVFENPMRPPPVKAVSDSQRSTSSLQPTPGPLRGRWRIRACCTIDGNACYRNLPATNPDHGDPEDWAEPGPIHVWLRERLIEAVVPFRSVHGLYAIRKDRSVCADVLLEHLPMTPDEIDACR